MAELRQTFADISLLRPGDWEDRSVLTFVDPGDDGSGFSASVTVTRDALPAGQTLHAFCDAQAEKLAASLPDWKLLKRDPLRIDEREAFLVETEWREFEGRPLRQLQYFIAAEARVVIVTGTALRSTIEARRPLFERIARSLQFK